MRTKSIKYVTKKNLGKLTEKQLADFINSELTFESYCELKIRLLKVDRIDDNNHKKMAKILYNEWHKKPVKNTKRDLTK